MKNMRKIAMIAAAALLIGMLGSCGNSASSAGSSGSGGEKSASDFTPVELSLATGYATTHAFFPYLQEFAQLVNEATNGDITITIYDSNTLVPSADMHTAVVSGVVDMVETDVAYDTSAFPLSTATYLPNFTALSSKTFTYAFHEFYQNDFDEFDGMKILWAYGMTPFAILSNREITKLEDMAGLQIRATGAALDAMTALGASPVGMPISETYEAASKGTVEAICNSFETLKGWNFAEVVKYGVEVPGISTGNHYIAINEDVWNSFPAEYQEAIIQISNDMVDKVAGLFDEIDVEGKEFGEESGIIFSTLSEEEQARWSEALAPIVDEWIADKTAMGYDAQTIYDELVALVDKYEETYG